MPNVMDLIYMFFAIIIVLVAVIVFLLLSGGPDVEVEKTTSVKVITDCEGAFLPIDFKIPALVYCFEKEDKNKED